MAFVGTTANQSTEREHRLGLIAARIGSQFAHKLGIAMPLAGPLHSTVTYSSVGTVRTTIRKTAKHFDMGEAGGAQFPIRALPGATVYLEVQDLTRLEDALQDEVKWACKHPECAGKFHNSKEDLFRAHGDNRDLIAAAATETVAGTAIRGRAHMYYAYLEIAGKPAVKTDKGITPAVEATVMILSDEA